MLPCVAGDTLFTVFWAFPCAAHTAGVTLFARVGAVGILTELCSAAGGRLGRTLVHVHAGALVQHPAHFALAAVSVGRARARLAGLVAGCADAVGLVPERAEVAVHAVSAQWALVPHVAPAGPVTLSAAVSAAVAIPAAGPLGPTLARFGGHKTMLRVHLVVTGGVFSHRENTLHPNPVRF